MNKNVDPVAPTIKLEKMKKISDLLSAIMVVLLLVLALFLALRNNLFAKLCICQILLPVVWGVVLFRNA